jgi:hypothetical protein
MYLVLSRSAVDAPRRAAVAGTVVVAAAYSALIAVAQGFLGSRLVPLLERHETGSEVLPLRASAFFADPNSLAVLLVLGALLALEACFRADSFRRAAPYLAAIVVSLAGIGATFSREAVVGLVVGGAAVLVFTPRPGRAALAGVVVVVIAAIAVLSVSGVGERVASILSPQKDTSSMARVHLAEVSLKMFADRPLTGVGISAFSSAYPAYRDIRIPEEASVNTHSMPFGIPAEMGILGLLAEACAAGAACIMAVKSRFLARRGVGAGPVAAMLAFLAMSFFNSFLFIESFWTAAALAGAVLVAERVGALPWVAGRLFT